MWEVLLDAVIDTLKVLPILLLVYLLIEFLSHMKNDRFLKIIQKSKKAGPIFGSCIGIIPQCGFSALAADLFSRHKITIGTVVAVFLATSDEAIPILISKPESYLMLLKLIGIKLLVGIFFGFMIDIFYNLFTKNKQQKIR
ncbi:MAG: putative manganese transporter, partial [Clostridia bacterium]